MYIESHCISMQNSDILYYLALQNAKGIGDINAKKLIGYIGSAQGIFEEKPQNLEKIPNVGSSIIKGLQDKSVFAKAEKELEFINNNNIKVSAFLEDTYPEKLQHCVDGPILLFQKGKFDLKNQRIVSIVGTRNMTNYGKFFLQEFVAELKAYHPIIVSGLAYGVDVYAHQQAIENKMQTIGVLAHGLDAIYPKTHQKTALEMQENGGLFTEFWSNTNPDRENFVKRNRIVAGLSAATIVIESAEKGGSLITANIANSYHRDVFAVPGRLSDQYSKGCNHLIKTNQAHLLQSAKDLAYILNWDTEKNTKAKTVQKQLFVDLNTQEKTIYEHLLKEGKQPIDVIALHCKYPIHKTASLLLNLELKGVARPLPGKIFEVV